MTISMKALAAELDEAIASKVQLVNEREPTFGMVIARQVLNLDSYPYVKVDDLESVNVTSGKTPSGSFYHSQEITDVRRVRMTANQKARAWEVLEKYELVGESAKAARKRHNLVGAVREMMSTQTEEDNYIANLIVDAIDDARADGYWSNDAISFAVRGNLLDKGIEKDMAEFCDLIVKIIVTASA